MVVYISPTIVEINVKSTPRSEKEEKKKKKSDTR